MVKRCDTPDDSSLASATRRIEDEAADCLQLALDKMGYDCELDGVAVERIEDCIKALRTRSQSRPTEEVCWLIERGQAEGQSPTLWWVQCEFESGKPYGSQWTESADRAQRFPTKEKALWAAHHCGWLDNGNYKATEHVFLNAVSSTREISPEWCMEAFWRVNPGRNATVPSLYLLDFAREVLRTFAPSATEPMNNYADTEADGVVFCGKCGARK